MTKKIAILILLLAFCTSVLAGCAQPDDCTVPPDCGEDTAPGSQIQPRESEPIPAQPGEGPNGLPTPSA